MKKQISVIFKNLKISLRRQVDKLLNILEMSGIHYAMLVYTFYRFIGVVLHLLKR